MNRQNLLNVYETINYIARNHEKRGRDCSNWFYSNAEFEELKKSNRNTIL